MLIVGRVYNTKTIPDLKGVNRSTYAYLHPLIRNRRWITEIVGVSLTFLRIGLFYIFF